MICDHTVHIGWWLASRLTVVQGVRIHTMVAEDLRLAHDSLHIGQVVAALPRRCRQLDRAVNGAAPTILITTAVRCRAGATSEGLLQPKHSAVLEHSTTAQGGNGQPGRLAHLRRWLASPSTADVRWIGDGFRFGPEEKSMYVGLLPRPSVIGRPSTVRERSFCQNQH